MSRRRMCAVTDPSFPGQPRAWGSEPLRREQRAALWGCLIPWGHREGWGDEGLLLVLWPCCGSADSPLHTGAGPLHVRFTPSSEVQ